MRVMSAKDNACVPGTCRLENASYGGIDRFCILAWHVCLVKCTKEDQECDRKARSSTSSSAKLLHQWCLGLALLSHTFCRVLVPEARGFHFILNHECKPFELANMIAQDLVAQIHIVHTVYQQVKMEDAGRSLVYSLLPGFNDVSCKTCSTLD